MDHQRHSALSFLWGIFLALALCAALLPLDVDGHIDFAQWFEAPSAYFASLPAHGYQLIKTAILWAPVGFLYTLAGDGRVFKTWAPLGVLTLLVVGMVILPEPGFKIALEAISAIPGLAFGMWLASRTKDALPAFIPTTYASAKKTGSAQQGDDKPKQIVADVAPIVAAKPGFARSCYGVVTCSGWSG